MRLTDGEHTGWGYRYQERLGSLCETKEPTPEQMALAAKEANEAILALRALIAVVNLNRIDSLRSAGVIRLGRVAT